MKIAGTPKPGQIPYIECQGNTFAEMYERLLSDPGYQDMHNRGDIVLVWVNDGDLDIHNLNVEFQSRKQDPADGI